MKISKFFVLLIVTLSSISVQPHLASSAAPPPEAAAPAASSQGTLGYSENCAKELSEKCGNEIFSGLFLNKTVTNQCCKELVAIGKPCHMGMVSAYLSFPLVMPNPGEEAEVFEKSEEVWSQCASVGHVVGKPAASFAASPSPSSF